MRLGAILMTPTHVVRLIKKGQKKVKTCFSSGRIGASIVAEQNSGHKSECAKNAGNMGNSSFRMVGCE